MKKLFLALSLSAVVMLASSCTKSYTCTCYDSNTSTSSTSTVKGTNEVDAALKCSNKSGGSVSCSL